MVIGYLTGICSAHRDDAIRREISAIEALGHEVRRYALRAGDAVEEQVGDAGLRSTTVVLDAGVRTLLRALGAAALGPFGVFLGGVWLALRAGRRSRRGPFGSLGFLAEACLLLRCCRRDGVEHLHARAGTDAATVAVLARRLGGPGISFTDSGGEARDARGLSPLEVLERSGPPAAEDAAERRGAGAEAARKVALFTAAAREELGSCSIATLHAMGYDGSVQPGARSRVLRWTLAQLWRAAGRAERNRAELYGGAPGLRIVIFHLTPEEKLDTLKRVVEWWQERLPMASPADVDELLAGRLRMRQDRLLVTFDDGLARHHEAARWLADVGVRAVFFIIPSLLDRSVAQFVRYHAERGVRAFPPVSDGDVRGLSTSQVQEMLAMGHRIGAHNHAHRDLGRIRAPADLRYEVDEALSRVADLTGAPCEDFAIGFGQPYNLSLEAAQHLQQRCEKVYMCHRGLNVPGRTPRFLLRQAHEPWHPMAFTRLCLQGGLDHRLAARMLAMKARVGPLPDGADPATRLDALRTPG